MTYKGRNLDLISFPLGGIGAGMLCLQGTGSFGSVSLCNKPNFFNNPNIFSAITVKGKENISRILEAPVPSINIFANVPLAGTGLYGKNYGLPRFTSGEFHSRFPFASINLSDHNMPISVRLTGWSPFIPNDEDHSSLPFAGIEYTFVNESDQTVDAVYYFNSFNFMSSNDNYTTRNIKNGFVFEQHGDTENPHLESAFCASLAENAYINVAWFRGSWFDTLTMLWNEITKGICKDAKYTDPEKGQSAGASIAVPFTLKPNESKTIKLRLSWYVPESDIFFGEDNGSRYKPWYSTIIGGIEEANRLWNDEYDFLFNESKKFSDCFYDTTLPEEIIDAVSANLSILKSPTILRQTDGRLWGWEGCNDNSGSCHGSCTHVWNYAQAICHLFPRLEQSLRQSEFFDAQDDVTGHQQFRVNLPIQKTPHDFHAASDGQPGGIIKVYRDWRINGDTEWLKNIWPRVKQSLNYCINQWDTEREGVFKQPHHNTYDIEFWGPDGMCTSFYLGALKAAYEMGIALGENCKEYLDLYQKGRTYLEENLYNGEYFYQKVMSSGLNVELNLSDANRETKELLQSEGPKYQYGTGCLSDGVVGVWLSEISGLSDIIDEEKLKQNLLSIYRYNFKNDLSAHANPQRPGYAINKEAGLLLCTWPKGGKPSLPFVYSEEVFTGIEYQVASHLLSKGYVKEGLDIVRACRSRYDGTVRNPYNEYECGHWYARAMASYALLQAYTGVRYDNITKTLYYSLKNVETYRTFISTATGYGTVKVDHNGISVDMISGFIDIRNTILIR